MKALNGNTNEIVEISSDTGHNNAYLQSPSTLAYLGDSVFEMLARDWALNSGTLKSGLLHKKVIKIVNCKTQAQMADIVVDILTEKEKNVYRRGRNSAPLSMPKNAEIKNYCKATGLEAVFGYLYLDGNVGRINEIFDICLEVVKGI